MTSSSRIRTVSLLPELSNVDRVGCGAFIPESDFAGNPLQIVSRGGCTTRARFCDTRLEDGIVVRSTNAGKDAIESPKPSVVWIPDEILFTRHDNHPEVSHISFGPRRQTERSKRMEPT